MDLTTSICMVMETEPFMYVFIGIFLEITHSIEKEYFRLGAVSVSD